MKIQYLVLAVGVALVAVFGALTPALGGSPSGDAAAAKKLAKKALRKANEALRVAKRPGPPPASGPAGPPGPVAPPGPVGPAGSALAYGKVASAGELDPTMSKGIAAPDVSHPQPALYCFDLDFVPKNVVASLFDPLGGEVTVQLPPSVGPACGEDNSASVITANSSGAGAERGFFVLFN